MKLFFALLVMAAAAAADDVANNGAQNDDANFCFAVVGRCQLVLDGAMMLLSRACSRFPRMNDAPR